MLGSHVLGSEVLGSHVLGVHALDSHVLGSHVRGSLALTRAGLPWPSPASRVLGSLVPSRGRLSRARLSQARLTCHARLSQTQLT